MTTNIKTTFAHVSQNASVPGNKGAIFRLCLVAVTLIIGLVLTVAAVPYVNGGLGDVLIAILTGFVCSIMAAALFWGFAKWTAFIFPKALAGARRFWNSLYALSLLALVIKVMVWIYLLMLPIVLYGIILTPLYLIVFALSLLPFEFIAVLLLVLLSVGVLFFVVLLDVCKLTDRCWKQTLRSMFNNARQKVSAAKKKA